MSDRHASGATASLPVDLGYWEFTGNMQATWPDAAAEPARRSGVACAIIVLRYMLSCFEPETRQRFLDNRPRGRNPLLEHALLQSDSRALGNLCAEIEAMVGFHDLCFKSLMENPVMQQTLWDTKELSLFLQVLYRRDRSRRWEDLPDGIELPPGDNGLILWDGRYDDSLSDVVAQYFGVYPDRETGEEILRVPSAPWFIRMRYNSNNPNRKFFYDLAYFELSVPSHPSQADVERKAHYRCVAAVKLRDTPDGSDTLRLYRPTGVPFFPERCAFPLSDEWSLPDKGKYMLYFVESSLPLHPDAPQWFDKRDNPLDASFAFARDLAMKAFAESDDEEGNPGATSSGTQPASASQNITVRDSEPSTAPRLLRASPLPVGGRSSTSAFNKNPVPGAGGIFRAENSQADTEAPDAGQTAGDSRGQGLRTIFNFEATTGAPSGGYSFASGAGLFDDPQGRPSSENTSRDHGTRGQGARTIFNFGTATGAPSGGYSSASGVGLFDDPQGRPSSENTSRDHGARGQISVFGGNTDRDDGARGQNSRPDRGPQGTRRPLMLSDANLTEIGSRGELGSRLRPPASQSRPSDSPLSGSNSERIGSRRLGSRLSLPNPQPEPGADNDETFF